MNVQQTTITPLNHVLSGASESEFREVCFHASANNFTVDTALVAKIGVSYMITTTPRI